MQRSNSYKHGWLVGLSTAMNGYGFFGQGPAPQDNEAYQGYIVGHEAGTILFNRGHTMSYLYKGEPAHVVDTDGHAVRLSVNGEGAGPWLDPFDNPDVDVIPDALADVVDPVDPVDAVGAPVDALAE